MPSRCCIVFNCHFKLCRWLVEDEGVGGAHGVLVRHHQCLISKLLLRLTAVAIAQASIAGSQGGPSNLQSFGVHHPPTFTGGGDPMVADHWIMHIENVLEAMKITSDNTRIRLVAFQLEGEA